MYRVTKTYDHNIGLSATFRQHKASSHCRFGHGYPLRFELTFASEILNRTNWVLNFGGLKEIKSWLETNFDHRFLVAKDDPELETFKELHEKGLIDLNVVEFTGCEAFAKMAFDHVNLWLQGKIESGDVDFENEPILESVKVSEHGGNSASYSTS